MRACNVDLDVLSRSLVEYIDTELANLATGSDEEFEADRRLPARHPARRHPRAVVGPRGGHRRQRARRHLRRAREPRRLFPAGAGDDALRRGQLHQPRHRQARRHVRIASGARRRRRRGDGRGPRRVEEEGRRARGLLRQSQREGAQGPHRSADRARERDQPHDPDPLPPAEEQSAVRRRSRRRQDGDRRGPRQAHRRGRCAGGAAQVDGLLARHGHAARRHALSRRFRGTAQAGHQGDRGVPRRDHVHRRDPHGDRRRRHLGRRDGRVQPAQAGAGVGHDPLHRLDHLQGVPPVLREGPGARPPLPEDRHQRADDPGRHRDPQGPEALLRGLSPRPLHQRRDQERRSSCRRATSTTASCPTRRST